MLGFYSGWGFWEYDTFDYDGVESIDKAGPLISVSTLFELSQKAENEINYQGKTEVDYLLPSDRTNLKMPSMNNPNFNSTPRFIICEENKSGQSCLTNEMPIIKTYKKYTKKDIDTIIDFINAEKEPIEICANLEASDQPISNAAINIETVSPKIEGGRRPKQNRLILSIIDELEFERLNIPTGGKQIILKKCLIQNNIFSSPSVFKRVWSELSNSGQISITDKEKYL